MEGIITYGMLILLVILIQIAIIRRVFRIDEMVRLLESVQSKLKKT